MTTNPQPRRWRPPFRSRPVSHLRGVLGRGRLLRRALRSAPRGDFLHERGDKHGNARNDTRRVRGVAGPDQVASQSPQLRADRPDGRNGLEPSASCSVVPGRSIPECSPGCRPECGEHIADRMDDAVGSSEALPCRA